MAGGFGGRVALVTGAGSGIGAATARALAREGATVILADIDEAAARRVATELSTEQATRTTAGAGAAIGVAGAGTTGASDGLAAGDTTAVAAGLTPGAAARVTAGLTAGGASGGGELATRAASAGRTTGATTGLTAGGAAGHTTGDTAGGAVGGAAGHAPGGTAHGTAGAAAATVGGSRGGLVRVLDVADSRQVDDVVDEIVAVHGRLDVVVHCAGVDDAAAKERIAERLADGLPPDVTPTLSDDRWRRVLAVNLDGTFHVLRAAVRVMVPRGAGAVVAVGSSAAFDAPSGYPHYAASKAGVHALCQAVAKEVVGHGVRVNVVAPGPTETGMAARTPPALRESMAGALVRPYATPEEIADVALFLAGDGAANLAGAVLLANGGRFTR